MKIIGYFLDSNVDSDVLPYDAKDVFVAIDSGDAREGRVSIYAPIGQHSEADLGYIEECIEISKESYLEASKLFYTPSDYI